MGKLAAALGIVPAVGVVFYFLTLTLNIVTIFWPTLHIPYFYSIQGAVDSHGQPLLPGNGPYLGEHQLYRLAVWTSRWKEPRRPSDSRLLWRSEQFRLSGTASATLSARQQLTVPLMRRDEQPLQQYAHVYMYPVEETELEASEQVPVGLLVVHRVVPLIHYQPRRIQHDKHLMSGDDKEQVSPANTQTDDTSERVAHWQPLLELDILRDRTEYPRNAVPGDIHLHMQWVRSHDTFSYLPIVAANELAVGPDDLTPLASNGAVEVPDSLPLTLRLNTPSLGWFRLSRLLWLNLKTLNGPAAASHPSAASAALVRISDKELDQFRSMIINTDPWLLLATIVTSVLHLLFEWLAFKEDVAHWRKVKDTAGVSRVAVILEAVSRCVAVLFLWERRKDTSILIIGGAWAAAAVEVWKVIRVLRMSSTKADATVSAADARAVSEEQIGRDADQQCVRTIGCACVPLAIGYAVWSLYFMKHASFRAWAVDALMASVYLLGFITLTPQLFLNYRLQSVAAMPIRVFFYRALNTFVDDLFALVLPMPGLTRLAAFRDDVVFIILLWQWWRYPSRKESALPPKDKQE